MKQKSKGEMMLEEWRANT